ncbi:hypothetical protein [Nocardia sp. NBC_01327]|uniref:hypothetical protein n=1 Tax=Nocardia sp. NBC_01327 TaxID=2903593 RepID=UPI002E0ECA64|nr:hypothetical protein OG326_41920 [Nocardia sp. NBC_01327]
MEFDLQDFDADRFFDEIVHRLDRAGVLKSSPTDLKHPEWPSWTKAPLRSGATRQIGVVEFIGDQGYDEPTPRQVNETFGFHDFSIDMSAVHAKSRSVRSAIRHYFPPDDFFGRYLPYFTDNLDRETYLELVRTAIDLIPHQFNFLLTPESAPIDIAERYLSERAEIARFALRQSDLRARAAEHPQLVLALAVFHAAHGAYTRELRYAVDRSDLGESAKDVAYYVLDEPLAQFDNFIVFSTLLLLIILSLERADGTAAPDSGNDRDIDAIASGWQLFFRSQILHSSDLGAGLRMTCPASPHLAEAQRRRAVERVYQYILENQGNALLGELIPDIAKTCRSAWEFKQKHFEDFLVGALRKGENARGGQGLDTEKFTRTSL